ncbi:heterokaryon incompatibility protein-domain-containing protein [Stachybotrys elegans]|uniref:Heterokaryon incompatibility protein-domain-containing protein n=1 Tax=Stachybotrys elegans TaxID=80388 RepID=A0A8K0T377_9HYPO|nr:heterokaryon incompatibility protein-domain-containing protein [Stachybotrys elegans]
MAFIYNKLKYREIRVFTLCPGCPQDELAGILDTIPFDPEQGHISEFEALSYTWGDLSDPGSITMATGGVSSAEPAPSPAAKIGRNLADALRHLRLPSTPRSMWIDSICINQEDLSERAEQVQFMGEIYARARRVIVWLGLASYNSHLAVSAIRSLAAHIELSSIFDPAEMGEWRLKSDADPGISDLETPLPLSVDEWQAIADLVARPWFGRLWIRQEITLANDDALVVVGHEQVTWTQLLGAVCLVVRKSVTAENYFDDDATFWQDVLNITSLRKMKRRRVLYHAIGYTQGCLCSDNRDRVYALLNLIQLGLASMIKPDYRLTAKDVYRDLVLKATEWTGVMGLMDCCDAATEPTWVPDLDKPPTTDVFDASDACGDSLSVVKELKGGRLQTHAVRCDELTVKVATCKDVTNDGLRDFVDRVLRHFLGPEPDCWDPRHLDRLTQCLLAGKTRELTDSELYPNLEDSAAVLREWARQKELSAPSLAQSMVLEGLRNFLRGRSVFQAQSGSPVLASRHAEPGGVVSVMLGVQNPMVLHPVGDEFRVVAPSYHPNLGQREAIYGKLPDGWRAFSRPGEARLLFQKGCLPPCLEDPRMKGWSIPEGWEVGMLEEGWPYYWRSGQEKDWTWFDPRLMPDELVNRGVALKTIVLC